MGNQCQAAQQREPEIPFIVNAKPKKIILKPKSIKLSQHLDEEDTSSIDISCLEESIICNAETKQSIEEECEPEFTCPICLRDKELTSQDLKYLDCKHYLCHNCYNEMEDHADWRCPMCRAPIGKLTNPDEVIIVAEDNPLLQLLYECYLVQLGYENVCFADNGLEAIELITRIVFLDKQPISKIFIDVNMPTLNGFDSSTILTQMMANDVLPKIEIWGLLTDRNEEITRRCKAVGMKGTLLKPFSQKAILKVLRYNSAEFLEL